MLYNKTFYYQISIHKYTGIYIIQLIFSHTFYMFICIIYIYICAYDYIYRVYIYLCMYIYISYVYYIYIDILYIFIVYIYILEVTPLSFHENSYYKELSQLLPLQQRANKKLVLFYIFFLLNDGILFCSARERNKVTPALCLQLLESLCSKFLYPFTP